MFPSESFLTEKLRDELQVGLGDELFFVGLFKEHSGLKRNVPIVRAGNIAAIPEEPIKSRNWPDMEAVLSRGPLTRRPKRLSGFRPSRLNVDCPGRIMAGQARLPRQ